MQSESAFRKRASGKRLVFFLLPLLLLLLLQPSPAYGYSGEQTSTILAGHVLNASSFAPIPNAKILVEPGNLSTEADANGSFSLTLPSGGNYTLNASAEGYIPAEDTIYCEEGKETHIDLLLFPNGTSFENGTIYGYVFDGVSGLGVASANITLTPGNISTSTDNKGFYSISARGSTYYTITANKTGYYNASTFIFLEPNGSTNASLYLTPVGETIGWIYGYVFDATNGTRIENAAVSVYPGGNTTYSDNQGYYNITVIGEENYTVEVMAEGYQASSKTVHVASARATRCDIPLTPNVQASSRIEGYVYDIYTQSPIQSAIILATPGNLSAVTNASGYYQLELTPGVNYTVKCIAETYLENHTYVLLSPDEVKRVDFYLQPEYENGRLHGRVLDITNQQPLAGALIVVEPDGISNYTNLSGEYEFLLRKGMDYRVSVSCTNYTPQTTTFYFNEDELVLDILLYPKVYNQTVNITGRVRNPSGQPVENAEVVLRSTDGSLLKTNYTDKDGKFQFLNLPVLLNYTITISAEGYNQKTFLLSNTNFTSEDYSVPPELTRLEWLKSENIDLTPVVIAAVLITIVTIVLLLQHLLLQRR